MFTSPQKGWGIVVKETGEITDIFLNIEQAEEQYKKLFFNNCAPREWELQEIMLVLTH